VHLIPKHFYDKEVKVNKKRISISVLLLVFIILTACNSPEKMEIESHVEEPVEDVAEDQAEEQIEEQVQVKSDEQPEPPSDSEETPSLEALSVITSQNAYAINQIYVFDKIPEDFAWSPDGKMIAFISTHRIFLFDTETFEEIVLATSKSSFSYSHISFSPNGDLIAVSNDGDPNSRVEIYNIQSQDRIMSFEIPEGSVTFDLAFSPDNSLLVAATGNLWGDAAVGGIKVWDLDSGELIGDLGHEYKIAMKDLSFNHVGNLLASISESGRVHIWEMDTMQATEHFWGSDDCYYSSAISYSPDDKILAISGIGCEKGSLKLIDAQTKDTIYDLPLDDEFIISIAFNPGGDVLVSTSFDSVRLWNTRAGQQLAKLDVKSASHAAFNPDGTILATGGGDLLRLWVTSDTSANTGESEITLLPPRAALWEAEINQRAEAFEAITTANAEAWNDKDLDAIQAILTEDIHFVDVSFGDDIKGIEDVMDMSRYMCNIAPDLQRKTTSHYIGVDQGIAIYDYWNMFYPITGYTPEDPFIYVFLFETRDDLISYWRLFEGFEMLDKHFINDNAANDLQAMISAYTSAWSSKDQETIAEIYAEDAIRKDRLFGETQQGLKEIQTFAQSFFSWYPNSQWTFYEMFGEKRYEGKPQTIGSSYGIQTDLPTGETCEVMVVVLLQVLDGKIIQEDLYYDPDTLIKCGWAQ
jgi:WD40 repeat protein